jgi:hypothetical protein
MKLPSFTEWLFGVIIWVVPQMAVALVLAVPMMVSSGGRTQPVWMAVISMLAGVVGVVVGPVIVFRWSRFFVRVASRKLFKQSRHQRYCTNA